MMAFFSRNMPLGSGHRMDSDSEDTFTFDLDGDDAQPVAPGIHFGGEGGPAPVEDAAMVPVAPDPPIAPRDAPIGPAQNPRRVVKKKLTNKEKAANGALKIGPWTRQRILCPHQPNGTMDIWVPEYGVLSANFTKSLCDTLDNFEKGRHDASSFYMFLVVDFCLFGWWVV